MSHDGQQRTCGADDYHRGRIETDDEYRRMNDQIEEFTRDYVANRRERGDGLREHIVTIPVVVHVVYNTAQQNISDAQIQSQIDALNRDFRANNADVTSVPSDFQPVVADTRIEFELARRDPDCNPTNGITRTETAVTSFGNDYDAPTPTERNPVKFTTSGGVDGWPSDEYLNVWICPLEETLMGYASFPAEVVLRPDEDGIVIDYEYFGTTGAVDPNFDRGRTAVHEVGHWLNLQHMWGSPPEVAVPPYCSYDDGVSDTPVQGRPNYGCPAHPSPSCGNSGDMFMNYMDYVFDSCMVMFTVEQSDRMAAALFGVRADIVGSDALLEPSGPADLWMQDTPEDVAEEPNTQSHRMYRSTDIWVRQTSDGFDDQQHQNPVYRTVGDRRNYVYVRVRCGGCDGDESGTLRLYWAKASTMLSWPQPWDGSVTAPALMGEPIGSQPIGAVAAGDHTILEFEWEPPNPADYASFGADRTHFCLLARIETESTSPFGMTFPEGSNLTENVRNNNNVAWKNISVMTETGDGGRTGSVIVGGLPEEEMMMRLLVDLEHETRFVPFLDRGRVYVRLGEELYERWEDADFEGENVEPYREGFLLIEPHGWIGDIEVEPEEMWVVDVTFEPRDGFGRTELAFLDLTQAAVTDNELDVIGGQRFVLQSVGELDTPQPAPDPTPEPAPDQDLELLQEWLLSVFLKSLGELPVRDSFGGLTGRPFDRPVRHGSEETDVQRDSREDT